MTTYDESSPVTWHISTYSQAASANCVEAGPVRNADRVAVRDSTRPDAGTFTARHPAWSAFARWVAQSG